MNIFGPDGKPVAPDPKMISNSIKQILTTIPGERSLAKAISFGLMYGMGPKIFGLNQEKNFKVGDHVVYNADVCIFTAGKKAWGVVTEPVYGDRVMVDWGNDFDNLVLGRGPFWHNFLEPESDLDRFAREI